MQACCTDNPHAKPATCTAVPPQPPGSSWCLTARARVSQSVHSRECKHRSQLSWTATQAIASTPLTGNPSREETKGNERQVSFYTSLERALLCAALDCPHEQTTGLFVFRYPPLSVIYFSRDISEFESDCKRKALSVMFVSVCCRSMNRMSPPNLNKTDYQRIKHTLLEAGSSQALTRQFEKCH